MLNEKSKLYLKKSSLLSIYCEFFWSWNWIKNYTSNWNPAHHRNPTSRTKVESETHIDFFSKLSAQLRLNLNPIFDSLHHFSKFHLNPDLEKLFRTVKHSVTKKFFPFTHINNSFSLLQTLVCWEKFLVFSNVLIIDKHHILSYNTISFTIYEQKFCTTYRKLLGILYVLVLVIIS